MNEKPATRRKGHYIHNVTYTYRERLVGAFVLSAGLAFLVLLGINASTTHYFEDKVVFHAYLGNGNGVSKDMIVKVAGIDAGYVSVVEIADNNEIHVELSIYEQFRERIRSNASASLNRLSTLVAPTIEIAPGTIDAAVLPDGSTLEVHETLSVEKMMESLGEILAGSDRRQLVSLVDDLGAIAVNLRAITDQIRSGEGAAGALVYDAAMNQDLVKVIASLQGLLDASAQRMQQTGPLLAEANRLIDNLGTATAEVPALVAELRATAGEANQALGILSKELDRYPDLMSRADLLLRDTRYVVDALQRIWPLSSALEDIPTETLIPPRALQD